MLKHRWAGILLATMLVAFIGCTAETRDEVATFPVKGTISYNGEPLADGNIQFISVANSFTRGIPIVNGSFSGESIEGEIRVEITAYKEGEVNEMYKDDPNAQPEKVNYIPAKHNQESTLTQTVSSSGENNYTIELEE